MWYPSLPESVTPLLLAIAYGAQETSPAWHVPSGYPSWSRRLTAWPKSNIYYRLYMEPHGHWQPSPAQAKRGS